MYCIMSSDCNYPVGIYKELVYLIDLTRCVYYFREFTSIYSLWNKQELSGAAQRWLNVFT